MWSLSPALFSVFLPFRYHLRDIVVGKIYFLLVRIKIKHMEIAIIKKETSGSRESGHMPQLASQKTLKPLASGHCTCLTR